MKRPKIKSLLELYDTLPEQQQIILDVLRQIVIDHLPTYCKEKISYNVPYFYGHKGICIIWPAAIPRGGISDGVLFGFWQGPLLQDPSDYLIHGTNKKIFYKVFTSIKEIDHESLSLLLNEAVRIDKSFSKK